MKSFKYTIKDPQGVHARPAGIVVAEAKKYQSNIKIKFNGKEADAKRIFGVMGLCIKAENEIEVVVEGADEDAAAKAMQTALSKNL